MQDMEIRSKFDTTLKLKIDFNIPKQLLPKVWPSFFSMGSCFAANQAMRMSAHGLVSPSNPFGILYNPVSIARILERCAQNIAYQTVDFESHNKYYSWEHHGDFIFDNASNAAIRCNQLLAKTHSDIEIADAVIITLGTSLVFTHKQQVVANCHKLPSHYFEQRQLSFAETTESLRRIADSIYQINKKAQVIWTLSPVRHLRSGVVQSSVSKAFLLAGIHNIVIGNPKHTYFPAYEVFMDELRDYRFAKEDMMHPTEQAEMYIWQRYCQTYFSDETIATLRSVQKYRELAAHRPRENAHLHQQQVVDLRKNLIKKYPFLHSI